MLIYRIKAKTRRQSVALFNLRWNVDIERPIFFFYHFCACLQITMKAPRLLILGLQIPFSE